MRVEFCRAGNVLLALRHRLQVDFLAAVFAVNERV